MPIRSASALGPAFFPLPVRFPSPSGCLHPLPELLVANPGALLDAAIRGIKEGAQFPGRES